MMDLTGSCSSTSTIISSGRKPPSQDMVALFLWLLAEDSMAVEIFLASLCAAKTPLINLLRNKINTWGISLSEEEK
jgi:hypothetical protein